MLSACSDALVALGRIGKFLTAEELAEPYLIDQESKFAVNVEGDFTWEAAATNALGAKFSGPGGGGKGAPKPKKDAQKGKKGAKGKKDKKGVLPTTAAEGTETPPPEKEKADDKPFDLKGLRLKIAKGSFVAVVGRVGSGKSSLLQALIGEMRRTRGDVCFLEAVMLLVRSRPLTSSGRSYLAGRWLMCRSRPGL